MSDELLVQVYQKVKVWKSKREELKALEDEIALLRGELSQEGIEITLKDYLPDHAPMTNQATAIVPGLPDYAEGQPQENLGFTDVDSAQMDQRTAIQVRNDSLVEETNEHGVQELAGQLGTAFQRAVDVGFAASSQLQPFSPQSDGQVRTRGFGG